MDWKQVVGGFVLLVMAFILVNNGSDSNKIIASLADAASKETKTLQGR